MYVVHVVQAHVSVRNKTQRCSAVPAQGSRSKHTWWGHGNKPNVIYMPPQEQGVIYKAGSVLYGTPCPAQAVLPGTPGSDNAKCASRVVIKHNTAMPVVKQADNIGLKLRCTTGGSFAVSLQNKRNTESVANIKPGSNTAAIVAAVTTAVDHSTANTRLRARDLAITLPGGKALVSASSCKGSTDVLQVWASGRTNVLPVPSTATAAHVLHVPSKAKAAHVSPVTAALAAAAEHSQRTGLLQQTPSQYANQTGLISSDYASNNAVILAAAAAAAAVPAKQLARGGALQQTAPVAACVSAAGSSRANTRVSSSYSATPAFSVPGSYGGAQEPPPFEFRSSLYNSRFRSGGSSAGGSSAEAKAASLLPARSMHVAKLGIGLMGVAAAATMAGLYWKQQANRHEVMHEVCDSSKAGKSTSTSVAAALEAVDHPMFHEWMVQRLEVTLKQFEAERGLLKAELNMLQALDGGGSSGNADVAALWHAAASMWSTVKHWLGGNSSRNDAPGPAAAAIDVAAEQASLAVSNAVSSTNLTPAAIASRVAELEEQIGSLDVLQAALSNELEVHKQQGAKQSVVAKE